MTVLVYPCNTSGFSASFGAADQGADVVAIEPSLWPGAMWMTGLEQTDRESTFDTDPKTAIRYGWLKEMGETNYKKEGGTVAGAQNLFPDLVTQTNTHYEKLAKYAVRVEKAPGVKAKGKIILVKECQLLDIQRSPLRPFPITGARFIDASTGERKIVTFTCSNAIDCGDEGDIAVKVCTTTIGRESASTVGTNAAGVTKIMPIAVPCMDARGQRLPGIPPKPHQRFGQADRRVMAFGMRVLVTQDPARIAWDSFEIPGYDPRKYDVDLAKAVAANYKTIPGSISNAKMSPGGPIAEFDMNNGGGLRIGLNWPGRFLDWFKMTWQQREEFKDLYVLEKLGLFKAIVSEPNWAAQRPELVADTKSWGLVPGLFTFPGGNYTVGATVTLGTRKFKAPYVYEVTSVVDDDGYTVNTYPPAPWTPSTVYVIGDRRSNGTGRYEVVDVPIPPVTVPPTPRTGTSGSSGGPTGKGQSIQDGTVTWKYIGLVVPTAPTSVAPTGGGVDIADGARLKWKMFRPYFPGMSPWLYIREGRKISGQASQSFQLMCKPTKTVNEPLTPYGYPHFDVHWNNEFANDDGNIAFEGSSLGLTDAEEAAACFMQFGSIKPAYDECPNLLVTRCISGDRLGWVPVRIELSYIKVAQCAGIIAGIADQLGVYTGDLDYQSQIRPALVAAGFVLSIPKAA